MFRGTGEEVVLASPDQVRMEKETFQRPNRKQIMMMIMTASI